MFVVENLSGRNHCVGLHAIESGRTLGNEVESERVGRETTGKSDVRRFAVER